MVPLANLCLLLVVAIGTVNGASTPQLKEIFVGRCYDFNLTRAGDPLPRVEEDCTSLWTKFESAFAYKPSCGLSMASYVPFLNAAKQNMPINKSLFWSGTKDYAHRLSQDGHRYVTMEDTLIGYLADSLTWCGQESTPGINYVRCPAFDECDDSSSTAFWEASSTYFASKAEGEVYVLLDGSNPGSKAYRNNSFFASIELPAMNVSKVTGVNVMLSYGLGKDRLERCDSGSLIDLKRDVEAKPLTFRCEENPESVVYLMCADDPMHGDCDYDVGLASRNAVSHCLALLGALVAFIASAF